MANSSRSKNRINPFPHFSIFFFTLINIQLFFIISLSAQEADTLPAEPDTLPHNRVMIIPFNPDLYFSDADHELAGHNRKSAKEVRHQFRYGLEMNINARILDKYSTHSLLRDTAKAARVDLSNIYGNISYKLEKTPDAAAEEEKPKKKAVLADWKPDIEKEETSKPDKSVYKEADKKYMNVVVHNPDMFSYLSEHYGVDMFLFINQFELKTNYEMCLDRANKVFQREVKVHFSIYDKEGNHLYGDVVTVLFPSNTNDLDDIIRKNFPLIGDYMAGKLPEQPR